MEPTTSAEQWVPEVLVRTYRGDHLIEQRFCESPEAVADLVESWEARPDSAGGRIVVEPHPPEMIVALLRAIADAIEAEKPVAMSHALPHVRLQLVTEGTDPDRATRGELRLLWQELVRPGD